MPKEIIFYDSFCGICHFFVKWVMSIDREKRIFYAPIGGVHYKNLIPKELQNIDSVLFYQNGKISMKSAAVLEVLRALNRFVFIRMILTITPQFISDFFYDRIALNRRKKTCEIVILDDRFLK